MLFQSWPLCSEDQRWWQRRLLPRRVFPDEASTGNGDRGRAVTLHKLFFIIAVAWPASECQVHRVYCAHCSAHHSYIRWHSTLQIKKKYIFYSCLPVSVRSTDCTVPTANGLFAVVCGALNGEFGLSEFGLSLWSGRNPYTTWSIQHHTWSYTHTGCFKARYSKQFRNVRWFMPFME